MPLQNRVTPDGEIVVDPAKGIFMGNRGILHQDNRTLGSKRWAHKNWVTCLLSFGGRKRTLMSPGRYTELFFLDEAIVPVANVESWTSRIFESVGRRRMAVIFRGRMK